MATTAQEPVVGVARELPIFSTEGFGRRVLFEGERMRAVLVGLEPDQEIPLHAPQLDLVVSVLVGVGRVMAGDEARWVRAGDLAVIPAAARRGPRAEGGRLVALNVVSPPPTDADHRHDDDAAWPAPAPAADVAALIQQEHEGLRQGVYKLGALAGAVPTLNEEQARGELEEVIRFLREDLLPHAYEEECSVYPAVERVLGAVGGATHTMAVDHRCIASLVADLEELAAHAGWDVLQARSRRILHEPRALLELHFQKEEDVYLPLLARLAPDERGALCAHLAGGQPGEES